MVRWGLIGASTIAREWVIGAIRANGGEVVSVLSSNAERGSAYAADNGIARVAATLDEIVNDPAIDAVYVSTTNELHRDQAIAAASAGKHVLCEKPIALRASDIDQLIAARDRNGVLVSEAFMVTYTPVWRKVRDLLAEGAIGRLRHVQGVFTYFNRDPGNMRNIPELGGGGLPDIGVYPAIATRFATGSEPLKVQAVVERDAEFGTDIYSSVKADFGGFELSFYVSTQMANRQSMVFHGTEGFIEVRSPFNADRWGAEELELSNQSHNQSQVFRFQDSRQYRREAEAFAKAALSGDLSDVVSLESSRDNQRFIDAIYRAGEKDGWETV